MERELIGYWMQKEERSEPRYSEYAGHEETWLVHAGETPILRCPGPGWRRWVTARRPATRTHYYFWSRIGAYGSAIIDNEPKEGTHPVQMDEFELARAVDRGDARLTDEYKVITVGEYSSGEPMRRVVHSDGSRFEI